MAGKNRVLPQEQNEASGLSTVKAQGDEAPNPTEAEFPWTWRDSEPIGSCDEQFPGRKGETPAATQILFQHIIFQERKMIAAPCPSEAANPPPGKWFVNALAPHAKRDDNIFFKLSSGAIQNRAASIR